MKIVNQEAKFFVTLEFGSAEEFKQFSTMIKRIGNNEDASSLAKTSRKGIRLQPLTEEELNFIKTNMDKMGARAIGKELGRKTSTIGSAMHRLKHPKNVGRGNNKTRKGFTSEQYEFIRNNYGLISNRDLAIGAGHSESYTYLYIKKNNIQKNVPQNSSTQIIGIPPVPSVVSSSKDDPFNFGEGII